MRMNKLFKGLALGCMIAVAAMVSATAAQAAQGIVRIQNNTSADQEITFSPFGSWASLPASSIPPFSSSNPDNGVINFSNLGIIVNSITYRDQATTKGCNFRVQTEIFGGRCTVVTFATPSGTSGGGQTATCNATVNSSNSSTCDFDVTFTVSGF